MYCQTGWSCNTRLNLQKVSSTLKQKTTNITDILIKRQLNILKLQRNEYTFSQLASIIEIYFLREGKQRKIKSVS